MGLVKYIVLLVPMHLLACDHTGRYLFTGACTHLKDDIDGLKGNLHYCSHSLLSLLQDMGYEDAGCM